MFTLSTLPRPPQPADVDGHAELTLVVDSDADSDDMLNSSTSSLSKLRLLLRRQEENRGSTLLARVFTLDVVVFDVVVVFLTPDTCSLISHFLSFQAPILPSHLYFTLSLQAS